MLGPDRFFRLGDIELHLVQLPEKVVGELQVRLVDLVDEQDHLLIALEGLAQLAGLDVACDVVHAVGAELAVVEALDHIVDVETILGLGGGLHVPDDKALAHGVGDGLGQHGLAGAGLALDEQGLLEGNGDVHGGHQLGGGNVVAGAGKGLVHKEVPRFILIFALILP